MILDPWPQPTNQPTNGGTKHLVLARLLADGEWVRMIAGLGWDGMGWDDGKTYVSTWDEDDDGVGGWVGGKIPNGKYPLFFIEVYWLLIFVYWSVYSIVLIVVSKY